MRISFTFGADSRTMQGKGASRRLRHAGKVPAILYGAHKDAQPLVLDQQNLLTMISDERFYSSIVRLQIDGSTQEAIVKGTPQRGQPTTDTYALAGFAQALAMIDKACGIKR